MATDNAFVRISNTHFMSLETFANSAFQFDHKVDTERLQVLGVAYSFPGSGSIPLPGIDTVIDRAHSYVHSIDTSQYSATLAIAICTTRRLATKRKGPVYLDIQEAGNGKVAVNVTASSTQYPRDVSSIDLHKNGYEALWSVTLDAVSARVNNNRSSTKITATQAVELDL